MSAAILGACAFALVAVAWNGERSEEAKADFCNYGRMAAAWGGTSPAPA